MYRIGVAKKRGHLSEETRKKISDAHQKRIADKKTFEARKGEKPKDIRAELADYLGLNPVRKGSEASQEAPDGTKEENTR